MDCDSPMLSCLTAEPASTPFNIWLLFLCSSLSDNNSCRILLNNAFCQYANTSKLFSDSV